MSDRSEPPAATAPRHGAGWAFAWGFAEATIFFVVPDVLITRIALRDFRRALLASASALAGALLGGTAVWYEARHGAVIQLLHAFGYLPGINGELIASTGQAMYHRGVSALFLGGLIGQPYKLFAAHAGAQGVSLLPFLLASVGARFGRFALSAAIARIIGRALHRQSEATLSRLHLLVWLLFYLVYWTVLR